MSSDGSSLLALMESPTIYVFVIAVLLLFADSLIK